MIRAHMSGRGASWLPAAALVALCVFAAFATRAQAQVTYFSYDSTPGSWVGAGRTNYFVSPDTGWTFTGGTATGNNFVSLSARRPQDPQLSNYYWDLQLAAPRGQTIMPGLYEGAARYPFQSANQPGLTLSGNHRGNNENAGFFRVLEAEYSGNTLVRFAVDFKQFDEGNPNQWVEGQWRYNSLLPEPSALALLAPLVLVPMRRRRSLSGQCSRSWRR